MDAYEDACRRWVTEFDWIGFFDADEFFVLHGDVPLTRFLDRSSAVGSVVVNWALFGSTGHVALPPGLIIESFTRRAETTFFPTYHVKSFVRPRVVLTSYNPHYFAADGLTVDAAGSPVTWHYDVTRRQYLLGVMSKPPDYSVCQLNHYFVRSKAHWATKVARGYPSNVATRTADEFDVYDRNEVSDESAPRYVDGVKTIIASFQPSHNVCT